MEIALKIIGSGMILTGFTGLANHLNRVLELRSCQLRLLYGILLQLKSEIQYMNNPLAECFGHIGQGAKEPFKQWLSQLANHLEKKEGEAFQEIWEEELGWLEKNSLLDKNDIIILDELWDKLENCDTDVKMKSIDYVLLHIEQQQKDYEQILNQRKKVCTSLCLFVGTLTLIILL